MSQKTLSRDEKIKALKQEFKLMDSNNDNQNGQPFDRQIATMLYTQMDKTEDGKIDQEEFVRVWMNCEQQIIEKIDKNNEDIKQARMAMEQNKFKQIEQGKEQTNNSTLQINVIEGQNIPFEKSKVRISYKDFEHSTEYFSGNFPNYRNFTKTLKGVGVSDIINVAVFDSLDQDNYLEGSINIQKYSDQKIHDVYVQLTNPMKNRFSSNVLESQSKLHVQVHYIYMKSKITQASIEKWKEHIAGLETENNRLKQDLFKMHSRIDFLESLNGRPAYFDEMKPADTLMVNSSYEPKFKQVPPQPIHPILQVCFYLSLLLGLIACAYLDYKHHMMIDLAIVFLIVTMYFVDFVDFSIVTLGITILFLLASLSIEIAWYIIYTKNWHNSVYIDDGSLVYFRKYQKYISWISLGIKGILLLLLLVSLCLVRKKSKTYESGNNYKTPLK